MYFLKVPYLTLDFPVYKTIFANVNTEEEILQNTELLKYLFNFDEEGKSKTPFDCFTFPQNFDGEFNDPDQYSTLSDFLKYYSENPGLLTKELKSGEYTEGCDIESFETLEEMNKFLFEWLRDSDEEEYTCSEDVQRIHDYWSAVRPELISF